ncbi:acyltransferase family protein [Nocardiopsis sp. NPDC050513]|uniref:acyltransferase family protein n=1 Tax=Nocardiopsis sp. NPDC050513 TaxID=3364338 RepID=UPI00378E4AD2
MSQDTIAPDSSTADTSARLHGLDALRGGALLLGILLHALLPFLPGMPWVVTDPTPTFAVALPIFVIHLFRMVLFMALAGYFGAMVLGRRGPWRYLRDRVTRILLPTIVFWPVSVGSLGLLAVANTAWRGVPAPEAPEAAAGGQSLLMLFTPAQLWFLWTLTQIVVIVLIVRAVTHRLFGPERVRRVVARAGDVLSSPGGVLLAALPYLAGLVVQGDLTGGGIDAPMTIVPEASSLVPYLGAFAVGWALHSSGAALPRLSAHWVPYLVAAVASTAAALLAMDGWALSLPVEAALIAVAGWTWTYGLLGLCVRHLNRERPTVRYVADASYWAYLMHMPLLILGEILVADQPWPVLVKLGVVLAATCLVLLVSYHLLVRSTPLGRWLNGRRHPFRLRPSR